MCIYIYIYIEREREREREIPQIRLSLRLRQTVSGGMEISWGDSAAFIPYNKGVTPEHTYPYSGLYRIQVLAPSGLDSAGLTSAVNGSIREVEAWAPQFRTGQSPGYTGTQLSGLIYGQKDCTKIPDFAYSNLFRGFQFFSAFTQSLWQKKA